MKLKIAVVQFKVRKVSDEENLKKAELFIKKVASLKSNIIVFPEDFITRMLTEERESIRSYYYVKLFKKLAKRYKIDIVPGSIIEREGSYLYNTSYYINSIGRVLAKYRKVHLWASEKKKMKSGHNVSVFKTKYGKIALIICWDLMFPDLFKRMNLRGAEIVICPSFWCKGDAGKGIKYDSKSEKNLLTLCA